MEKLTRGGRDAALAGNLALVVLLGFCWGFNWPAVRLALDGFPPFTFRAIGFTSATLLLFAVVLVRGLTPRVPRRDWASLVAVGMLSVVAYNMLSAFAQLSASTSRAAVLSYTMPIWAVVLARLILGEHLDRRRLVGLTLGAAGLVALGLPIVRAGALTPGLFFAIGSGVVWAAGSVVLKRYPIDAPPLVVTMWQLAMAALISIVAALAVDGLPHDLPRAPHVWAGLVYNVVIGQAVATTLWFTILARMPVGLASIGSLLVPGIGVIGATLILGETPTGSDWLGLVLIVAAAAVVLLRPAPSTLPAPARSIVDSSAHPAG